MFDFGNAVGSVNRDDVLVDVALRQDGPRPTLSLEIAHRVVDKFNSMRCHAEDFVADRGGQLTMNDLDARYARSQVRLDRVARLIGVSMAEEASVETHGDGGFLGDVYTGMALEVFGKTYLPPRKLESTRKAFTPTHDEMACVCEMLGTTRPDVATVSDQVIDGVHSRRIYATRQRAEVPS